MSRSGSQGQQNHYEDTAPLAGHSEDVHVPGQSILNSYTPPLFFINGAKSGFEMCFGPSTLGAGAKTRLESRIKEFTPHCVFRPWTAREAARAILRLRRVRAPRWRNECRTHDRGVTSIKCRCSNPPPCRHGIGSAVHAPRSCGSCRHRWRRCRLSRPLSRPAAAAALRPRLPAYATCCTFYMSVYPARTHV